MIVIRCRTKRCDLPWNSCRTIFCRPDDIVIRRVSSPVIYLRTINQHELSLRKVIRLLYFLVLRLLIQQDTYWTNMLGWRRKKSLRWWNYRVAGFKLLDNILGMCSVRDRLTSSNINSSYSTLLRIWKPVGDSFQSASLVSWRVHLASSFCLTSYASVAECCLLVQTTTF